MKVRKNLGLLFFVFSFSVCCINLSCYVFDKTIQVNPLNVCLPLILSLMFLFTVIVKCKFSEWLQVILVGLAGGSVAIFGTSTQQFLSALMFVIAFGMLYQYKLIRIDTKSVAIAVLIVFVLFLIGCFIEGNPYRALNMLGIFMAFSLASYWLFGYEIKKLSMENAQMAEISRMHESSAQITHLLKAKTSALQTIADGDLNDEQYLSLLKLTIDDVQDTVSQIMTYARSSTKSEPELINVEKLMDAVCLMVENLPGVKGRVEIEKNIISFQPLKTSPSEFKAVIQNLITNAVEAIPDKGKVIVTYSGSSFRVEDTGTGIPFCRECYDHNCLLCPKFSSGKTTKSTGNGLGVAQVKQFCRDNGYGLKIISRSKGHTSFSINFNSEA